MSAEAIKRKLTTILEADVAGYSLMMAADEEAALHTLDIYRGVMDSLIEKHEGRIVGTAGDSVLAEFGSPVEAVRCAISIQDDLTVRNSEKPKEKQMWFRIGINVGDVMTERNDLFGDGVNVAARLESLAEPGGVCISGSTFDLVKNKMSVGFRDMGPQQVKNIPHPVPAFSIVGSAVQLSPEKKAGGGSGKVLLVIGLTAFVALIGGGVLWVLYPELANQKEPAPQVAKKIVPGEIQTPALPPASQAEKPLPAIAAAPPVQKLPRPSEPRIARQSVRSMSAADIKMMMQGLTIRGIGTRRPWPFTIVLKGGGVASVTTIRGSEQKRKVSDSGNWWSEKGRFCMKFNRFAQGHLMCPNIVRQGKAFSAFGRGGKKLNWTITR